jgi:glutamine synthetase
MIRESLIFVATCDISGHVRGKAFPSADLDERRQKGVGWTHSNIMMSAFGPIFDTPFGTGGDLMIVPDSATEVNLDFLDGSPAEHFILGDIRNTDGSYWECCPRDFLRRANTALEKAAGLRFFGTFEHEFLYTGNTERPADAYALRAFRRQGAFGETLTAALRAAGLTPDSFLPEYGPRQFEVTVTPRTAIPAADNAVITREVVRATALRFGHRAIFSPMPAAEGVGNGVHIHMSLRQTDGTPATYDPAGPLGLSPKAAQFAAGILHHLPAISAITAPSPVSYLRLTPNRWAPTRIDIVQQDRGAALRVCPVFNPKTAAETHRQFNMEFRVADSAASPYLALGAILFAGADGIAQERALPAPGGETPTLPRSLGEALDEMERSEAVQSWFGPVFMQAYLRHKRAELNHVKGLSAVELCQRYAEVY